MTPDTGSGSSRTPPCVERAARDGAPGRGSRSTSRGADNRGGRGRSAPRQARPRPRCTRSSMTSKSSSSSGTARTPCYRRRRRHAGDEPRLLVHESRARVRRARAWRRALLPSPQPLVADGPRAVLDSGVTSPGSSTRRRRGDRAREAECRVLRRRVQGARLRAGDDVDDRRRPRDGHRRRAGRRHDALLVRTGKFRPDALEASRVQPDGIVSSIAHVPDWLEDHA